MKVLAALSLFFAGATALGSIADYVKQVPSCAFSEFKSALDAVGCDTSKVNGDLFECWCDHVSGVITHMTPHVSSQCISDFADAYGHTCGVFIVSSSSAPDFAAATSALASELGSKGAQETGSSSSSNDSGSGSTSSSDGAAAPTAVPKALGWVGGAAALVVPLVL